MLRFIEMFEDDRGKLSLSHVLAFLITVFVIIFVFLAMYDKRIDYTLIGYLMGGYVPYTTKQLSQNFRSKQEQTDDSSSPTANQ